MERRLATTGLDKVFGNYAADLELGISLSGYCAAHFALERILICARLLRRLHVTPTVTLDFGCGNGAATPFIIKHLAPRIHYGVDISEAMLATARQKHRHPTVQFEHVTNYLQRDYVDAVYSNGVFHHIEPFERDSWYSWIHAAIRPGGLFFMWENNAWSPAARMVMNRIPFDKGTKPLSVFSATRYLRKAGFRIVDYRFAFIFPRALSILRFLEKPLQWAPLGSQFLVVGQRLD